MLLVTESALSSQVSIRDVSVYSPSHTIPLNQGKSASNGCEFSYEPAPPPIAMAKVLVTVTTGQKTASTQERELIEQSLVHWCNTSRTKFYG